MNPQSVQHIIPEVTTADIYDNNIGVALEQFLIQKKSELVRPNTIRTYKNLNGSFVQWCDSQSIKTMLQITTQVLSQYTNYMRDKGFNKGNIITNLQAVKVFIRWYYYNTGIDDAKNPFRMFKMPKREQKILDPITDDQIEALLKTCKEDTFKDSRDRLLIMILRDTGCRASESCSILLKNVDHLKRQIFLESESTKGGKSRYVSFTRETKLAMNKYLQHHAKSEKWLFTTRVGDRMTFSALRQTIQDRAKEAKIGKIKIHGFRRYFVLRAVRSGMPLLQLSRILGHRDVSLLSIYAQTTPEDLSSAYHQYFEDRDR